jgi:hypothetical protein
VKASAAKRSKIVTKSPRIDQQVDYGSALFLIHFHNLLERALWLDVAQRLTVTLWGVLASASA